MLNEHCSLTRTELDLNSLVRSIRIEGVVFKINKCDYLN